MGLFSRWLGNSEDVVIAECVECGVEMTYNDIANKHSGGDEGYVCTECVYGGDYDDDGDE